MEKLAEDLLPGMDLVYHDCVVLKSQKAGEVMTTLTLKAPHLDKAYQVPGQWVAIQAADGTPNYVSFLTPPGAKQHTILVKTDSRINSVVVRGSDTLKVSELQGFGLPFREVRGRRVLALTMGTAAAPMLSLLKHMEKLKKSTEGWQWVHGLKQPDHLPLKPQWAAAEKSGIEVNLAYSAHRDVPPTRVQAMLYQMPPLNAKTMVAMVCGSTEMMTSVRQILLAKGFTQDQIMLLNIGFPPPPPT